MATFSFTHRRTAATGRPRRLAQGALVIALVLTHAVAAYPSAVSANAPEAIGAHIVSTIAAEVRACPEASCAVRATAPLGADVVITGDELQGYVPVRFGDETGYVPVWYVAPDPAAPPFLAAGAPGCQRVAILFNIGVGYEPDTGILDTLQEEDVPAAMFVMGWWAEQNSELMRRLDAEGYLIGSHGFDAIELTTRSDEEVVDDIWHAGSAIEEALGRPVDRYFTPYAAATDDRVRSIVAELGYLPVGWEVPAADYGPDVTEASVYARVMDTVYDGAIVEFHLDAEKSEDTTGRALPRIITDLRAQGYTFVTIPELAQPC